MKKVIRTAMLLLISAALAGCSSAAAGKTGEDKINTDPSENAIENLTLWIAASAEAASLNPYHSVDMADARVSVNLYDGLITLDSEEKLIPAVAESWEVSEDGLDWTFHLRDDVYWVDAEKNRHGAVKAKDFAAGCEWALNFQKNGAVGVSMLVGYIRGAQEYLDYTKALSEQAGRELGPEVFREMVGVETPDDRTLVYHLSAPCPYFDSVVTYSAYYPAPSDLIAEIGVDQYIINPNYLAWYNGPYLLTAFVQGNEKIFDANPYWYGNEEHTRFRSVTVKTLEDSAMGLQLYKTGEVDSVTLNQAQVKSIMDQPEGKYYGKIVPGVRDSFTIFCSFNYCRRNPDGTIDENWNKAVSNEAFRKSLYYGVDFGGIYKYMNPVTPFANQVNTLCAAGLARFSDGRDYTEAVLENLGLEGGNGGGTRRQNQELALLYKEEAIEELTALGVRFPVEIVLYANAGRQDDVDMAKLFRDAYQDSMGTDYVTVTVKTYVSSLTAEVLTPALHSIGSGGWGADFGDPVNPLSQLVYGDPNAYLSEMYLHINSYDAEEAIPDYMKETAAQFREYTRLVKEADQILDDRDARYEAFAKAESYCIGHVLAGLPLYQKTPLQLSRVDTESICSAAYGLFCHRYVDWKTDRNGYGQEAGGKEEN